MGAVSLSFFLSFNLPWPSTSTLVQSKQLQLIRQSTKEQQHSGLVLAMSAAMAFFPATSCIDFLASRHSRALRLINYQACYTSSKRVMPQIHNISGERCIGLFNLKIMQSVWLEDWRHRIKTLAYALPLFLHLHSWLAPYNVLDLVCF